MNKEKVSADEGSLEVFEKLPVSRRQDIGKSLGKDGLLGGIGVERRLDAVR